MAALGVGQSIETLWHIHARLSRLVAIAFLWLIVLTCIVLTGLAWAIWAHWNTLQQMTAAVPAWLLGLVTIGGVVASAGMAYRAYHWLAGQFLGHYLFDGLGER